MLENTEDAIKKGQSRETGNIGYTQDYEKQNKNTTQYALETTIPKQTQKRKYKQLTVKTNQTSFLSLSFNCKLKAITKPSIDV